MNFIVFTIPLIFIIISVIFVIVFFGDSKKYLTNLDTQKQIELENLRKKVIDSIKNKNISTLHHQDIVLEKINQQSEEISNLQNQLKTFKKNKHKIVVPKEIKTSNRYMIEINQKNLIRGLITREYIKPKRRF